MTDTTHHLGDEIDGHKANLTSWIENVGKLATPESKKKVHERFKRDCETLIKDLDDSEDPSSADLVDFEDRHNSLEIQYHTITDSTQ